MGQKVKVTTRVMRRKNGSSRGRMVKRKVNGQPVKRRKKGG